MYLEHTDHLLACAGGHFGGLVGGMQQRYELPGRRVVPDGRGDDLGHEAVVIAQVLHLHMAHMVHLRTCSGLGFQLNPEP